MDTKVDDWFSHKWLNPNGRTLEHLRVVQWYCVECGRDFVQDMATRERYAEIVSVTVFHRLAGEISERWLNEPCPNERLLSDEDGRKTRFTAVSSLT